MRVLHAIGSLDPAGGGPPKIALCIAAAQAALGHDVRLVTTDPPSTDHRANPLISDVPGAGAVELRGVGPAGALALLGLASPPSGIAEEVEWADALHCHSVWEPLLPLLASAASRRGTPYIVLLNGMLDPWSLSQSRVKKALALKVAYRQFLSSASSLQVGNEDERALMEPLSLGVRTDIIPNGVFMEEVEPLPEKGSFRASLPELGDRRFVLFLSRLHFKKGLDVLADAYAKVAAALPDLRLVVAGPDDGYEDVFRRRVDEVGIADKVIMTGPLYGDRKWGAMVDAACFCLPSRQEGFSVAITEALACGCVPVITEGCHFPEVVTAGAGEVVALSGGAVADALRRVLDHPEAALDQAARGQRLVRERYTWPAIGDQLIDLYREFGA
ncbi:MAG: glycosyltransferase [Planctomycetota bacterium]